MYLSPLILLSVCFCVYYDLLLAVSLCFLFNQTVVISVCMFQYQWPLCLLFSLHLCSHMSPHCNYSQPPSLPTLCPHQSLFCPHRVPFLHLPLPSHHLFLLSTLFQMFKDCFSGSELDESGLSSELSSDLASDLGSDFSSGFSTEPSGSGLVFGSAWGSGEVHWRGLLVNQQTIKGRNTVHSWCIEAAWL